MACQHIDYRSRACRSQEEDGPFSQKSDRADEREDEGVEQVLGNDGHVSPFGGGVAIIARAGVNAPTDGPSPDCDGLATLVSRIVGASSNHDPVAHVAAVAGPDDLTAVDLPVERITRLAFRNALIIVVR